MIMDLSKSFDKMNQNLLIAKLGAYSFQKDTLSFMKSYLTKRRQPVRVNSTFSAWEKIISGVLQGLILGPLLFNIFLNDLFFCFKNSDLRNYAVDHTLYNCGINSEEVKEALNSYKIVLQKFYGTELG